MKDKRAEDDALSPLLEYFLERLNRIFAYHFSMVEFAGEDALRDVSAMNGRAWGLQTIQNACLHDTLMAIRDLNDFLSPRNDRSKPDDLKAADFGYPVNGAFLAVSELRAINKRVAHITQTGVKDQSTPWDIWELISKCVAQADAFLSWIEREYGLGHFLVHSAALVGRTRTKKVHEYLRRKVGRRP